MTKGKYIRTPEIRQKMRDADIKRYSKPEEIEKTSKAQKKRFENPLERQKMSEIKKSLVTPEYRKKCGERKIGTTATEETKIKMSLTHSERYKNPEEREKTRIANLKRYETDPELKLRLSNIQLNRYKDPENRLKLSIAQKKLYAENPDYIIKKVESHLGGFWYGNIRYYDDPYCEKWNEDLRERVRAFWNYTCFECGTPQNGHKLSVHHIHYNKKTCCDGSPHDMIPLCKECHAKSNYNRDYWEYHFTELLYAISPDGKCYFTKEEMALLVT